MDVTSPPILAGTLACLAILLLPGAAIYSVVLRPARPVEALLYAPGLSVAFWPLLLLYISLLGGRFTLPLLWIVLLLSAGALAWSWATWKRGRRFFWRWAGAGQAVALLGMLALALIFRLRDIRGLPVPLFGDSLHHTIITQIILDTGRVPSGYMPYAPVDTFTYHFGFHTLAAVLGQVAGMSAPQAVLLAGQMLVVAALPGAYLLASTLFNSRTAGLFAALLTGFVSVMPAYYINWGRYTQLAGMVLLPAAIASLWQVIGADGRQGRRVYWARAGLAAFCVAGLVVVHYRILIFYGLFALALAVWQAVSARTRPRHLAIVWAREGGVVLAGFLATSPWIWNLATNYLPGLTRRLSTVTTEYISSYNSLENLRRYIGVPMVLAAGLGLGFALWALATRRPARQDTAPHIGGSLPAALATLAVATWAAMIAVSIWVVPGAIGSFSAALALYLPLATLGGFGIARLLLQVPRPRGRSTWVAAAPALLAVLAAPLCALALGTWQVTDPGRFSYVHEGDLQAFDWIRRNTPPESKFLISSEFSYAGRGLTASDAGMWLPLLAGRNVNPPTLAAWSEHPTDPDFFTDTRSLAAYMQPRSDPAAQQLAATGATLPARDPADPQTLALMKKLGLTHIYSGTAGGASHPRLDLPTLRRESCRFKLIYPPSEGVYVFQIDYAAVCK